MGSPLSPNQTRGRLDVKKTYPNCLMAASQFKSLTFARLSLLPSFGLPSTRSHHKDASVMNHGDDSSTYDFFISVFADFTAQYIDALCNTGNLPITQEEWLDDELKMAEVERTENEQRRAFGDWMGRAVEEDLSGPKEVNIMDRPDCLEDVFALVTSVCTTYPDGSKAFWNVSEEEEPNKDGSPSATVSLRLTPSRCLRKLDLIQSENESTRLVYLSFLASLALSDGAEENDANGASLVHSFLSGGKSINAQSERHTPFSWEGVINAIRWYAEKLSPEERDDSDKKSPADRLRRSSTTSPETSQSSTSYYYGVGNAGSTAGMESSSSTPEQTYRGQSTSSHAGKSSDTNELDEVGRNTLVSILCLVSNVASKCNVARDCILGIQLPVQDYNGHYQDGCLEILFALLTTSISPEIRGLTFMAIANLLQPSSSENKGKSAMGKRAWDLLECCQFIPIKFLSQYSAYAAGSGSMPTMSSLGRNQVSAQVANMVYNSFKPCISNTHIVSLNFI